MAPASCHRCSRNALLRTRYGSPILAMQVTATTNEAYPSAILQGFGDTAIPTNAQPAVFDAIRHITGFGLSGCDRWLGRSVRRLLDETPN